MQISSTPHIRSNESIDKIMLTVLIALAPACVAGVYFFGLRALLILVLSVASCVFFEAAYQHLTKQKITISDYSAAVTGVLLGMNLPVSSPFWLPIVGGLFAIVIVKQLFGGLGQNFMNPALAARAFLLTAYPVQMTHWSMPLSKIDAVSAATPLALVGRMTSVSSNDYVNAFIGNIPGCIGETSALALLIGGVFLLWRGIINWRIPATYLGTVFALTFILGRNGLFTGYAVYELLLGGLMLGAFFMATDYSSSPITPKGQLIFGVGCGILTTVIRLYGGYPEGVSYSILLMNLTVPLIDRFTRPRVFGTKKRRWAA